MTAPIAPSDGVCPDFVDASRLDDAGCVRDDALCVYCGYNLRTLAVGGRCPECGKPVAESVRSSLLKYANREWVENRVLSGLSLFVAALTMGLIGVAMIVLPVVIETVGVPTGASEPLAIIGGMLILLGGLMVLGTAVTCTAPEPGTRREPGTWTARRVTRWSLLTLVVLAALFVAAITLRSPWPALATAWLAAVLALAVLPLALLGHIAGIVRRIPDSELASRLEAHARLLAACGLIGVTLVPVGMRLNSRPAFFLVLICVAVYSALTIGICLCLRKADDEVSAAIGVDATPDNVAGTPPDDKSVSQDSHR